MNRDILSEILCDDFEILEAPNGPKCLELLNAWGSDISIVLLDIVMPDMDGFDVLSRMSAQGWLEDIPVVMISSEDSSQTVRRAYELGASDYISRPFDARIVHRRVSNVARLYARQRRLSALVSQQFYDREKNDQIMIGILSPGHGDPQQREHPTTSPGCSASPASCWSVCARRPTSTA